MYHYEIEKVLKGFGGAGIDTIALNNDKTRLYIRDTEGRVHAFHTEGDCCSTSWIENIEFTGTVLRRRLTDISEADLPLIKAVGDSHQNYDDSSLIQAYSTTFHTEGGALKVEYRNESNGYYGGSMEYEGIVDVILDGINPITGDI